MADSVTLNEIITAVRELTFDRFIIPAFAIKAINRRAISISSEGLDILTETGVVTMSIPFSEFDTLDKIMDELISEGVVVAYTPYFKGDEISTSLIKVKERKLDADFTAFRRYFFSDEEIKKILKWYYLKVLDIPNIDLTEDTIARLQRPSEQHMALWVAYYITDKRRLYEAAALNIGQSFTDGSDYTGSATSTAPVTTSVQIGSVFSLTENASEGYFEEDFSKVGSENIWGDRFSFWYKLMLYLRQNLEEVYGDYSLRKTNIIPGSIELERNLDFRSYYDSYPFTLSPLSRGILSKTP